MSIVSLPTLDLAGEGYGTYLGLPFDFDVVGVPSTETSNPTEVTVYTFGAFKRVWINYYFKSTAIIYWELERGFADPGPYEFQLQGSHSGTPRGDDWFSIGSPTTMFFATDDQGINKQRMFGESKTFFYRIVLTTPLGLYVSPIAGVEGLLNKHDWLLVREMLRQEQLAHKVFSSQRGYLLKARRYGPICNAGRDISVDDKFPGTIDNTSCQLCYGTGYINGYYPPTEYYALVVPSKTRERRELEKTGTTKEEVGQGRFLAVLPLIQGDVWIADGADDRYYIHSITEAAVWKSVPIVYLVELRLAPFTDIIYDVPVNI